MDEKVVYIIGHDPGDEVSKQVAHLIEMTGRNFKVVHEIPQGLEKRSEESIMDEMRAEVAKLQKKAESIGLPGRSADPINLDEVGMLNKATERFLKEIAPRTDRAHRRAQRKKK